MKIKTFAAVAVLAVAALAFSTPALADTIGGPNSTCGTCQGATYTLTYSGSPISSTLTTQTFRITLTIGTATYTGGGTFLDNVAIKVSSSLNSASLFAAPGGTAKWTIQSGGLDANGCSGSGSGFECAAATSLGAFNNVTGGGTFAWTFNMTIPTGTLFTGVNLASIKARYVNSDGVKVGDLVSEDIKLQTPVPEPGTMLLLGSGLLGIAGFVRRRFAR